MATPGAYAEQLRWLYGLESRGMRFELDRMKSALEARGNPQRDLPPIVHVAGSNGKGSVCAMVESMLRAGGLKTGWFSSPHLHRYVERVRISGKPLHEREAARRLAELREATGLPRLTFFEYTTLMAFEAFRDADCDAIVLEVGLGGRLDSTNVVDPAVSVITNITLEHQRILGDTLGAIAREKAGVLAKGRPAVIGVRAPEAAKVIRERARRLDVDARWIDRDFNGDCDGARSCIEVGDERFEGVRLGLEGAHQADNAACAVAAVRALEGSGIHVDGEAIREGLSKARWPGRLEWVPGRPSFLFDAAHNADGCRALAQHIESLGPRRRRRRVTLLFGAMADKDHEAMLAAFDDLAQRRVYAIPEMHRAADPADFLRYRDGTVARSVRDGLARARRAAGEEGLVVVAGSIFLVAAVRAMVKGVREDPPIAM